MMKSILAAFGLMVASLASPVLASEVPVMIMADDGVGDACAVAQVVNLNPNGDNFLALRDGPGSNYDMLMKLGPNTVVLACDYKNGWQGIIVDTGGGSFNDCNVFMDTNAKPYRNTGGCVSGWAYGKYLELIAG